MKIGIEVIGDDEAITAQTRAYAEYRVFAVLAKYTDRVRRVRVILHHVDQAATRPTCTCEVSVLLIGRPWRVRRRAGGPHPYAAINRAVDRIAIVMARRVELTPT